MKNYNDYVKHSKKITDVNMSMAVLGWDQETKMPKTAVDLEHNNYQH